MAETGQKKQLALDSNVLLDLGGRKHFAEEFVGFFKEKGFRIYVPPTVVLELGLLTEVSSKRSLATNALVSIRTYGLLPFEMRSVGDDIAGNFARLLSDKGLLPYEENRDGEILAETSLHRISILVTRDAHLLGIDETKLIIAFNEADLDPVMPVHPKALLKAAQQMS